MTIRSSTKAPVATGTHTALEMHNVEREDSLSKMEKIKLRVRCHYNAGLPSS